MLSSRRATQWRLPRRPRRPRRPRSITARGTSRRRTRRTPRRTRRTRERGERGGERKAKKKNGESNGAIITEHILSIPECALSWHTKRRHRDLAGWARFCHRKKNINSPPTSHARLPTPKWKGTVMRCCYHLCSTRSARGLSSTAIMAIAVAPLRRVTVAVEAARGARLLAVAAALLLAAGCWLARGCAPQEAAGVS